MAVSDFAADLPAASGKARVGGFSPDLEAILALKPDLIVVSRDGTDRVAAEKLQSLGLTVLITGGASLQGVLEDVRKVGQAIGESASAARFVESARLRIRTAQERVSHQTGQSPTAAVVIWPDPPVLAGPGSFIGDLLRVAGFQNVVPESAGEWPRVSYESLAGWNPDVVIRPTTPENEGAFQRSFGSDERWKLVPAVRRASIVKVPGAWIERPGPRLLDALEALVDLRVRHRP